MNPQTIDLEGPYRLLHCSSKGDKIGVMQELEKHVEPNLADYDKRTALHLASCEGCTEIVVLLLEKGADVNSVDRWGRTVSHSSFNFFPKFTIITYLTKTSHHANHTHSCMLPKKKGIF